MAGCASAYRLAMSGARVLVIEAGQVGGQGAATSLGILGQEPVASYRHYEAIHGRRRARETWTSWRRAMLDTATLLRRLKVQCRLEVCDGWRLVGALSDPTELRREQATRQTVGLPADWLEAERLRRNLPVDRAGALRTRGEYQLDPYRVCLGVARAAAKIGVAFHERSTALRIEANATGVHVQTQRGTIRADQVVVATGSALPLFKPLSRHLKSVQTYVVATAPLVANARAGLPGPGVLLRDGDNPPHTLRWTADRRVLFSGADQTPPTTRQQEAVLVQRAGQLMYELSTLFPVISGIQPEYAWCRDVVAAADGLPLVGPHRRYPRHLFVLGAGQSDITAAFLAARVIQRTYLGEATGADARLGFREVRRR